MLKYFCPLGIYYDSPVEAAVTCYSLYIRRYQSYFRIFTNFNSLDADFESNSDIKTVR